MGVSWTKEQRDIAKKDGMALVAIAVDGRHAGMSGIEVMAPETKEVAEELMTFIQDFLTKRLARLRQKKPAQ